MSHNQEAMAVDPTLPTGFTHGYVQTNGIRLHYVRGGQGTPVVLLHGFPENWYVWRHVMPVLARHYHVIALDMRGAGQIANSGHWLPEEHLGEIARQLISFIEE